MSARRHHGHGEGAGRGVQGILQSTSCAKVCARVVGPRRAAARRREDRRGGGEGEQERREPHFCRGLRDAFAAERGRKVATRFLLPFRAKASLEIREVAPQLELCSYEGRQSGARRGPRD